MDSALSLVVQEFLLLCEEQHVSQGQFHSHLLGSFRDRSYSRRWRILEVRSEVASQCGSLEDGDCRVICSLVNVLISSSTAFPVLVEHDLKLTCIRFNLSLKKTYFRSRKWLELFFGLFDFFFLFKENMSFEVQQISILLGRRKFAFITWI